MYVCRKVKNSLSQDWTPTRHALWVDAGQTDDDDTLERHTERKKENRQAKGGMGGRHAATTKGF